MVAALCGRIGMLVLPPSGWSSKARGGRTVASNSSRCRFARASTRIPKVTPSTMVIFYIERYKKICDRR